MSSRDPPISSPGIRIRYHQAWLFSRCWGYELRSSCTCGNHFPDSVVSLTEPSYLVPLNIFFLTISRCSFVLYAHYIMGGQWSWWQQWPVSLFFLSKRDPLKAFLLRDTGCVFHHFYPFLPGLSCAFCISKRYSRKHKKKAETWQFEMHHSSLLRALRCKISFIFPSELETGSEEAA